MWKLLGRVYKNCTYRSGDRPVRFGPRFSKFYWSWSGTVRDFRIFQTRWNREVQRPKIESLNFQKNWPWFGPVLNFPTFLALFRSDPRLPNFFWSWSGLFLGPDRLVLDQLVLDQNFWSVDPWLGPWILCQIHWSEFVTKISSRINVFHKKYLNYKNQRENI